LKDDLAWLSQFLQEVQRVEVFRILAMPGKDFFGKRALQRGESELPFGPVAVEDELYRSIAESAQTIIEDDHQIGEPISSYYHYGLARRSASRIGPGPRTPCGDFCPIWNNPHSLG